MLSSTSHFKPIDLYDNKSARFRCPACEKDLFLRIFSGSRNSIILSKCENCGFKLKISPPRIEKKLIYLDQWFVSNILDPKIPIERQKYYERLISKLATLIGTQKIFVVVSDIHAQEMSRIPDDGKRKALWKILNSLANGNICKEPTEIFGSQYERLLRGEPEIFPWPDILDHDPHSWVVGMRVIATGNWRRRLHDLYTPSNQKMNEGYREIINKQLNSISDNSKLEQCFKYICDLHKKELGILHGLPRSVLIVCALEAQRLYAALQTKRAGRDITKNEAKFSRSYGVLGQNDANHISFYAPYVDVFLTDNVARQKIMAEPVKDQVKDLKCSFISTDNIETLEIWIDHLISTPDSVETQIARNLLIERAY